MFDGFASQGNPRTRKLRTSKTIDSARLNHDRKSGRLVGEARALIRASPDDVVAYLLDIDGEHFRSRLNRNIYVRYETREVKNEHHAVLMIEMSMAPLPLRNRLLLVSVLWKKLSDDPKSYVWVVHSIESHPSVSALEERHAVRGHVARCVVVTDANDGSTRLEYAVSVDLKTHLPECTRVTAPWHRQRQYDPSEHVK
jgi:hypothetical protein